MVSVIIPVYNTEKYIHDAIQSVLNQSYSDFEIIVSDDGSTDSSLDIAASFKDPRTRILSRHTNSGIGAALNRGIRASKGSMIVPLAADDMLSLRSLEYRINSIGHHGLVCGRVIHISENISLTRAYQLRSRLEHIRAFYGPTVMIRRELFQRYGLFDESLRYKLDREMWIRLFGLDQQRTDRATFVILPQVLGFYRLRNDSFQHAFKNLSREEKASVYLAFESAVQRRLSGVCDVPMLAT